MDKLIDFPMIDEDNMNRELLDAGNQFTAIAVASVMKMDATTNHNDIRFFINCNQIAIEFKKRNRHLPVYDITDANPDLVIKFMELMNNEKTLKAYIKKAAEYVKSFNKEMEESK